MDEEPGRLQFMGLQGIWHNWVTNIFIFIHAQSTLESHNSLKKQTKILQILWYKKE